MSKLLFLANRGIINRTHQKGELLNVEKPNTPGNKNGYPEKLV